jgi:VanZ family protein
MSSPPRAAERAAALCCSIAFWLPLAGCTWLALTPSPPDAVFRVSDVVLHALAFAYLTFALGLAHRRLRWWSLAAWMLAYGAFIELAQSFEPARSPELKDLAVDLLGIAAGLAALALVGAWARRTMSSLLALVLGD